MEEVTCVLVYGEAPQSDMDWGAAQGRRLLEGRQGFRNMAGGGGGGEGWPATAPLDPSQK